MSDFIQTTDYKGWIDDTIKSYITGGDTDILDNAESIAEQMIKDACSDKYNVAAELAKTTTSRNKTLLRWMLSISVYFIYHNVPDVNIPERVQNDYDDARKDLEKVAAGKMNVEFARETDSDGYTITNFNSGYDTRRTHNPF